MPDNSQRYIEVRRRTAVHVLGDILPTMLPAGFISTYMKYKHDTEVVASWLATTAKEQGYATPLAAPASQSNPASTSTRLKGKARKLAQTQPGKPVKVDDKVDKPKYVLAIRDFVPLAQFISGKLKTAEPAASDGDAGIPSLVSSALKRAIQVRKIFSSRLSAAGQDLSARSKSTHAYFVLVLEKVRDILLKSVDAKDEATGEETDAEPESDKKFTAADFNMFDALRLYEPSERFLNAPDAERHVPVALEYTVEEIEESETEHIFAYIALLKDLISLREEIGQLWGEYQKGNMDLAATAVGVNTALELARGMEEEVAPMLEKLGGTMVLIPNTFQQICVSQGLDYLKKQRPTDDFNFACYEYGSAFMYNSLALLDSLLKGLGYVGKGQEIPFYNGKFGWYEHATARLEENNNRRRWEHDKAAMLEGVPDMVMLFELHGIPVQDEFARGIKTMFETQKISISLCFAAQNYLDTLRFLGPDLKKPKAELKLFNDNLTAMIENAQSSSGDPKYMRKELDEMKETLSIQRKGQDVFSIIRTASPNRAAAARKSTFLLHNPLFCGLWIHYMRSVFYRTSLAYAAKAGNVMYAVQLYIATRQHQQRASAESVVEWPDLDYMLEKQGPQAFFIGNEPPSTAEGHFKSHCMSRSISAANWIAASKRRQGKKGKVKVQTSTAGVRELKFRAVASNWSASRIQKDSGVRRTWNAAVVRQLLEASGWTDESQIEHGYPTLTAPQLVHHVARTIQAEIPDLTFNYLALEGAARGMVGQLKSIAQEMGLPELPVAMAEPADYAGLMLAVAAREVVPELEQSEGVMVEMVKLLDEHVKAKTGLGGFTMGSVGRTYTADYDMSEALLKLSI